MGHSGQGRWPWGKGDRVLGLEELKEFEDRRVPLEIISMGGGRSSLEELQEPRGMWLKVFLRLDGETGEG